MSIYLGSSEPSKIYVGSNEVSAVYVGTTKVRPSGWKPGSNTLVYLPLDGDANDSSGNNRNGTLPSSSYYSWEYISGNSGKKCWRGKSGSGVTPCISGTYAGTQLGSADRTISVWFKFDVIGTATEQVSPHWIGTANGGTQGGWFGIYCLYSGSFPSTLGILRYYSDPCSSYSYDTNWHNYIITYNNTNKAKIYVDGVQVVMTNNASSSFSTVGTNYYIGAGRCNETSKAIRYSEYIIENKVWGATDILNYYNNTKSNYGL